MRRDVRVHVLIKGEGWRWWEGGKKKNGIDVTLYDRVSPPAFFFVPPCSSPLLFRTR